MKSVLVRICTATGWRVFIIDATEQDIADCYALPKDANRVAFWAKLSELEMTAGHVLIWSVIP